MQHDERSDRRRLNHSASGECTSYRSNVRDSPHLRSEMQAATQSLLPKGVFISGGQSRVLSQREQMTYDPLALAGALRKIYSGARAATQMIFMCTSIQATCGWAISIATPALAPIMDAGTPLAEPAARSRSYNTRSWQQSGVPTGRAPVSVFRTGTQRQEGPTSAGGAAPSFIHPRAPRQWHEVFRVCELCETSQGQRTPLAQPRSAPRATRLPQPVPRVTGSGQPVHAPSPTRMPASPSHVNTRATSRTNTATGPRATGSTAVACELTH